MNRQKNKEVDFRKSRKSTNRKGKSGTKNRTDFKKEDRYDEEAIKGQTRASNDPDWYGADSTLMQTAAQIPFSNMLGLPIYVNTFWGRQDISKPGIMTLSFVPTMGIMRDWTSPYNVMIRDMYSFIRHANSGHSNYDAADLGCYFIQYDSVATFYAEMVRLYGLMTSVLVRNRYTPNAIVNALGYDYADFATNLADFRYYINSFAARFSAMKLPANINVLRRHMWMCSNIYMDAPVETGQMYVFKPYGFWNYSISDVDAKFFLEIPSSSRMTFDKIKAMGDVLLNNLLNSEDFNIMSGDIMKAYGDNVFSVNPIAQDYRIVPQYDPEILLQIHNATVFCTGASYDVETWDIEELTEDNANVGALRANFLVHHITGSNTEGYEVNHSALSLYSQRIVDMPIDKPTPKDVAIATRLMSGITEAPGWSMTDGGNVGILDVYGSEIIVSESTYHIGPTGSLRSSFDYGRDRHTSLEPFNAHPYRYVYSADGEELNFFAPGVNPPDSVKIDGDFDNVSILDLESLKDIHMAAAYGLFGLVK